MRRIGVLCVCLVLFPAVLAAAGEGNRDEQAVNREAQSVSPDDQAANRGEPSEAKELSGMSIVGNDEAPKSLYIVPWESSEIGAETSLDTMLNEDDVPVDRDVFKRQLGFYRVRTEK